MIKAKYQALSGRLDEATLRMWAATEPRSLGRGGVINKEVLGVLGVAVGFVADTALQGQGALAHMIARRLSGFTLSGSSRLLLAMSIGSILIALALAGRLPHPWGMATAGILAAVVSIVCIRVLLGKLGPQSRLSLLVARLPILNALGRREGTDASRP